MEGTGWWTLLVILVVMAAVLGPVATLRYLAVLERRRQGRNRDGS